MKSKSTSSNSINAPRNYQMDNLRCLLIFLVVFGHMLELFSGKKDPARALYLIIYSFHMPLFCFVSGVFAKLEPACIPKKLLYPYVLFQTAYILFSNYVLKKETALQFATPYWLLWYLFALMVWELLLPLLPDGSGRHGRHIQPASPAGRHRRYTQPASPAGRHRRYTQPASPAEHRRALPIAAINKSKALTLTAAFTLALLAGFDSQAGYFLSLSRILTFFPFFLLGYYSRDSIQKRGLQSRIPASAAQRVLTAFPANAGLQSRPLQPAILSVCAALVAYSVCAIARNAPDIPLAWLYASASYEKTGFTLPLRALSFLIALAWLGLLLALIPRRRLPLLSYIGAHTMPIYLLHGFLIRLMKQQNFFQSVRHPLALAFLLALLLIAALSSPPILRLTAPLFSFDSLNICLPHLRRNRSDVR